MTEPETDDRPRRRVEITEGQVVRWLCYAGFFYCAINMVTGLSTNSPWVGYLLGAVLFGVPALRMYVLYQERERTAQDQAGWAARHGSGRSKARFDFGDGEGQ